MQTNAGGNFNWITPVYDALAFIVFGRHLQQAQVVFLDKKSGDLHPSEQSSVDHFGLAGASVLLVGGGTGWLLEQILLNHKPAQIVYLEPSAQMVTRASRRIVQKGLLGSVQFRVGNETALLPNERFDVIFTPFVLDLFSEQTLQTDFIPRLHHVLKPAGLWFITDFVQPSIWWQKALLWFMIRFFRLTAGIEANQLADWQQCLLQAGLVFQKRKSQVWGMVSAEVWSKE